MRSRRSLGPSASNLGTWIEGDDKTCRADRNCTARFRLCFVAVVLPRNCSQDGHPAAFTEVDANPAAAAAVVAAHRRAREQQRRAQAPPPKWRSAEQESKARTEHMCQEADCCRRVLVALQRSSLSSAQCSALGKAGHCVSLRTVYFSFTLVVDKT